LRASDAERDAAVDRLRDEFVEGRLSQDTFMVRVQGALAARRTSELRSLLADLPEPDHTPGIIGRVRELAARVTEPLGDALRSAADAARNATRRARPVPRRWQQPPLVRTLCFPPPGRQRAFTIGRGTGCDLLLPDPAVSREHARLIRYEDGWQLADLNSTNGTWVNDWRIREPVVVRPGDRVRLGSASYILRASSAAIFD
jgi:hypothetical protein